MSARPHLVSASAVLTVIAAWGVSGAGAASRTPGALTPLPALTQPGVGPIRDLAFDARGGRIYAIGGSNPVHASLARNARTGALQARRAGTCSTRRGLSGRSCRTPAQIEISADGRNGYILGDYRGSAALTMLVRGRAGALAPVVDGAVSALGNRVRAFVLSRDGRNAYVAVDRSVVKLDRARSGRLVLAPGYRGCHQRRKGCPVLRGVLGASGIALSADGRSLYVTSERGVAVLRRSTRSGGLRQLTGTAGCIAPAAIDGCAIGRAVGGSDSPTAIFGKFPARRIVVSRDGARVYAASSTGIAVFAPPARRRIAAPASGRRRLHLVGDLQPLRAGARAAGRRRDRDLRRLEHAVRLDPRRRDRRPAPRDWQRGPDTGTRSGRLRERERRQRVHGRRRVDAAVLARGEPGRPAALCGIADRGAGRLLAAAVAAGRAWPRSAAGARRSEAGTPDRGDREAILAHCLAGWSNRQLARFWPWNSRFESLPGSMEAPMRLVAALGAAASLALALSGCGETASSAAQRWQQLRDSTLARTEVAAARVGDGAYVVGGFAAPDGATTGVVERYDLRRDRWTRVAPIPQPVNHAAAVAYRGAVYVVGGYTAANGLAAETAALWRYDPGPDRWTRLPDAPTPRAALVAGVIADRMYVAGGARDGAALKTLEIYDFGARRWSAGPPMTVAREHLAGPRSAARSTRSPAARPGAATSGSSSATPSRAGAGSACRRCASGAAGSRLPS